MSKATAFLFVLCMVAFQGDRDRYPQDYFRSPLGIPLLLSGNFAEMRSNHLHSGLDIKTSGSEGYRIYAAAGGWVSRIKVSPYGFGHALYVDHPNGYTTVYAHLSRYKGEIADYVKAHQYRRERFSVDLTPPKNALPVSKGQVIALSGNTGGSSGPHLHFEIRDAASQRPINPLLFGLDVYDTLPPRIYRIKLYPLDESSFAFIYNTASRKGEWATQQHPVVLETVLEKGRYRFKDPIEISAQGKLGFGIQTHDYHNDSRNRLGAFRIQLSANGAPLFHSETERFSFGETRYINAHVDYAERVKNRRWFQRSYLLPGNNLSLYKSPGNGHLTVNEEDAYAMQYFIEDTNGNTATLDFEVRGTTQTPPAADHLPSYSKKIPFNRSSLFTQGDVSLSFPANTFYEDLYFSYEALPNPHEGYSALHQIHDKSTPAHKRFRLSIRADQVPASLRAQALLARVDDEGNISSAGGKYEEGYVKLSTNSLGTYFITVDTLAPEIKPLNIKAGGKVADTIRIRIKDDFSGISSYVGTIDNKWVLFAYDPKTNSLTYRRDEHVSPGTHTLRIRARDGAGNTEFYSTQIKI